jgi:flagellar biosynthesis protein FlhA
MRIGNFEMPLDKASLLLGLKGSKQHLDIFFAAGILCIIAVLIFPIPSWLIDFLLTVSISFSVIILMTVLFVNRSLDFSSFPSILLIVTMLRLALNISSTRLILSQGHSGTDAAGHVIQAFGIFVMQGSVIIGAIVFGNFNYY